MQKIKHSKKPRIKVKTIKIKGEGLVQVLDGVQKRIEDLSHNEMMNGAQVRLLATRDREKYKKLWIEYEVLLKKYVFLAESIVEKLFECSKAAAERDILKASIQEHKTMKDLAEARAEEFGERNISYGEEVENLRERITYLRDQLRLCNPKHDEFEEEGLEEKNFYHSRLNGKRKPGAEH
jgi:predicted  nucleic acid-binding Zn-ribbon protein